MGVHTTHVQTAAGAAAAAPPQKRPKPNAAPPRGAMNVQVVPVLEQQLGDVQADLQSQERMAKELTDQVLLYPHISTRRSFCRPTMFAPAIFRTMH